MYRQLIYPIVLKFSLEIWMKIGMDEGYYAYYHTCHSLFTSIIQYLIDNEILLASES